MPNLINPRWSARRTMCVLSAISAGLLMSGCGVRPDASPATAAPVAAHGSVHGGQQPVQGSVIQLYAVGSGAYGAASSPMLTSSVTTAPDGTFNITGLYSCASPSTLVYIVSSGGNPGLAAGTNNLNLVLMGAIGRCDSLTASTSLQINEVTTVAAVAALAPYMTGYANVGAPASDTGMPAAFLLASQLASLSNGISPGAAVPATATVPVALIDGLANVVATCVNSSGGVVDDGTPCGRMFSTAKVNGYPAATDTVLYLILVSEFPALATQPIFDLIPANAVFMPQISSAPATFAIGLVQASPLTLSLSNSTFPATYVGALAASQAVTVTNVSSSAVTLSPVALDEPSGGADFIASSNCPTTLAASATCTTWVNFTPQVGGGLSTYLAVTSPPQTVYAAFSGTALLNPPATFPDSLNNQSIFIGASICQAWSVPAHNAGVSGDTTAQILARFPAAVLGQGYSTVVLMGGSNDVREGVDLTGVSIPNVQTMGQMAANAGMQVVIAAIPPIYTPGTDFSAGVNTFNQGVKQLAIQNGWLYLDFYTPLVGHPEDFVDGLHPNAAGYALMLPVLTANVTR